MFRNTGSIRHTRNYWRVRGKMSLLCAAVTSTEVRRVGRGSKTDLQEADTKREKRVGWASAWNPLDYSVKSFIMHS